MDDIIDIEKDCVVYDKELEKSISKYREIYIE
jgi:hypothetical protein